METKFTTDTLPEAVKKELVEILKRFSPDHMQQSIEKIHIELAELHKFDSMYNEFYGAFDILTVLKNFFKVLVAEEKVIEEARKKEIFEKKRKDNKGELFN